MQTYYQKHHNIKATQYDGTLKQLRDTLPSYIFTQLITDIFNPTISTSQLIYQPNRQVILIMNNKFIPWSKTSVKYHHQLHNAINQGHNNWQAGLYNNQIGDHKAWRRKITPKNLYPGQYLSIHHHYSMVALYSVIGTSDHYTSDIVAIKIHERADFEAHWSKTPIKKRSYHGKR